MANGKEAECLAKVRRPWKTENIVPQEAQAPIRERYLQRQVQAKAQSQGAEGIQFNFG